MLAAVLAPDLTLSAPVFTASRALFIAASALRLVFDDTSSFYEIEKKIIDENRIKYIFTVSLAQSDALFAASILKKN